MRRFFPAAICATLLFGTTAYGDPRPYDNGPVWEISAIETKPGHFDDYMAYVATTWRQQEEALKKQGVVLDYKVLSVADQRDNEPDVYLMVEYKNMAAYDVPLDQMDATMAQTFGSVANANKGVSDRESIRTLRGQMITRELTLK